MAFVAPLIAGAIGVGAVGEFIIGAGLSLAMGAASRALAPKPNNNSTGGQRLSLRTEANGAREFAVGRAATAGTLIYFNTYGANGNDTLQLVFQLADHECDALEKVFVNGVEKAWNSGTGAVTDYAGMTVQFYAGTYTQTADANLIAQSAGRWTSTERGRGICYVIVTMAYNQTLYPSGLPKFLFVIRGAKLYDIRKDSTAGGTGTHRWGTASTYEWTDNPVVIAYNYARGIWLNGQRMMGMNTPGSALEATRWIANANICDEAVTLAAGGTEPRYKANGVISSSSTHREVFGDLTRSCAGLFIETSGQLELRPGAARTAVVAITDDDLIDDAEIEINAKRPRSELINAVFGSFHDPAQQYEMVAIPPRLSPADEATDGNIRLEEHYALDLVTSQTQGQRILEIMRRRARQQRTVRLQLPAAFSGIEAGDWVSYTSTRYGWSTSFEVSSANVGADKTITISLNETSSSVYVWTTGDELSATTGGTLPAGAATFTTIAGLAVATISIAGGTSEVRPGLQVTWTSITDPTVLAVEIEYRRQGDTVALTTRSEQPGSGSYTFINGVQGSTIYEVRARPVVLPLRTVAWTGWATTAASTASQVVTASSSSTTVIVPANSVGPAELSPQARFELGLVTAVGDVQGSVAAQIAEALLVAQNAAQASTHAQINAYNAGASVTVETRTRQTALAALAEQITTALTTLNGHSASITQLFGSYDGIKAKYAITLSIDGYVTGYQSLSGDASGSTFGVLADHFYVAQPGVTGGAARQVFTIGNVAGVPTIGIAGNVLIDGSVTAQHIAVSTLSAIAANIGTLTAGKMLSTTGKTLIDLDNDRLRFIA